jgi:uncharacterized membrane protein YGL010W
MNQRLKRLFDEYAKDHQTKGNIFTHYFGIPMIVISLLGFLSMWVLRDSFMNTPYIRLDGGVILILLSAIYYFTLDWKITIPFLFAIAACYFFSRSLTWQLLLAFQVFGWILQLYGHYRFEKGSPAFAKNKEHLLIGPLWIFAKLVGFYS